MKTHKWADLRATLGTERLKKIDQRVARVNRHLDEIRKARGLTQVTLAEAMEVSQGQVAKIEHQADLYLSTLQRFIEAMGGEMEIVARFPDGEEVGVQLAEPREEDVIPSAPAMVSARR